MTVDILPFLGLAACVIVSLVIVIVFYAFFS